MRVNKNNRRQKILEAAERLMITRGLTGATTRRIAMEAGCSEGALYVHFKGRLDLLMAVLEAILLEMVGPLSILEGKVGQETVSENLRAALAAVYRFQTRAAPLFAGLFAEPKLLRAFRRSLAGANKGPHLSMGALASYIEAEQHIGRVDGAVDATLAASVLLSCCFFRAFNAEFFAKSLEPHWDLYAAQIVRAVLKEMPPNLSDKRGSPLALRTERGL